MTVSTHQNENRQKLQHSIVKTAGDLFKRQGIKGVRMDDIAHALSISKRTLYEIFSDKEELLIACLDSDFEQSKQMLEELKAQSSNVLETLLLDFRHKMDTYAQTSELFFHDLQRYPKAIKHLDERKELHYDDRSEFFEKGIAQGIFLPQVNYRILILHHESILNSLVDKSNYHGHTISEVLVTLIYVNLRGISTTKGQQILDNFFKDYTAQ